MTSSRFNLGSTLKTLNLSLLQFNERSGSENLDFDNLAHNYSPVSIFVINGLQNLTSFFCNVFLDVFSCGSIFFPFLLFTIRQNYLSAGHMLWLHLESQVETVGKKISRGVLQYCIVTHLELGKIGEEITILFHFILFFK